MIDASVLRRAGVVLLPFALAAVACASASAQGLVAAYDFDEASGRVARDGSGSGHPGRIVGARRTASGRRGGALVLDGRRDQVRVRARPRGRAMSFLAWVRPRAAGTVFARGRLVVAAGPRGARVRLGSRRAAAARRLRGWRHLAATYDGRALRLYVGGRLVARRAARGRPRGALRVGGSFAGRLDEVRIHRRALTARRIRAAMRGGAGGPRPTPAAPPGPPSVDDLPKLASVTKDGVTWTFSRPMPVGSFVTGDPYVVGAATVTAISPAPAGGRNGSVKNLPVDDSETGFDSRTDANRFEPGLVAQPPVALAPGDSLVSSISVDQVGAARRWLFDIATGSPVRSASVLTALAAPVAPDAFRPSYDGRGAPVYHARNLRRELLPRLAPVGRDVPSIDEFAAHFRRPWTDSLFFNFDTPIDYMPDYGREIARAVGMAGLLLTLDLPPERKEPLLVYLTQYGIDLHGLVLAGHPGWGAHGGHGSGRKLPIVLAGTLLGEPAMQRPAAAFGEDQQTMLGSGWTGASALYAGHFGARGDGESGPYEHLQPSAWPGTLGEDYRRCCTSGAWIGEALTAMLVPGVREAWDHPPFFAYADRWMTEDDTQALATIEALTGEDYSAFPQREAWDQFVTDMWRAYR